MSKSAIPRLNLRIVQGKTFQKFIRWEKEPFIFKAITGITRTAPARLTVVGHGLTDGWRAAVVSVGGMCEINAEDPQKLRDSDFRRITVIDANTVEMNTVNAAEFSAYTSGGYLQFYTPASLADCTARMTVRTAAGGTQLLSLTTEDNRIVLDDTTKVITLLLDADDTAELDFTTGVYDLEIEDGNGFVTGLYQGNVTVDREVTT